MAWTRAALALVATGAVALGVLSGGSAADPQTPAGLPGLPPPFLGMAVTGSGGLTAAIDAYGDVVDLRAAGPAGQALIDNPSDRQAAGSVDADTGIVPQVRIDGGPAEPPWRADLVTQRYLPGTNVVRTVSRFGAVRVTVIDAADRDALARILRVNAPPGTRAVPNFAINLTPGSGWGCEQGAGTRRLTLICTGSTASAAAVRNGVDATAASIVRTAIADDCSWLARALPLGSTAPAWAQRLYGRSLLTLRALTDRRTGALAAGARDGWAYVWPRDAGTAALALASAGYRPEARRVARFLSNLDLGAAARFDGNGDPVPGREAQGDAAGWVAVATEAASLPAAKAASPVAAETARSPTGDLPSPSPAPAAPPWRERPDYQERSPGTYLANALANSQVDGPQTSIYGGKSARRWTAGEMAQAFATPRGLVRRSGDPRSGLDSAAAWAVQPFSLPALFPTVRRSLRHLVAGQTRFGITPSEDWPGVDPWTAPTAWTAWSLAALSDPRRRGSRTAWGSTQVPPPSALQSRRAALRLLGDLRRAATPAGTLPERVDARSGVPRSTTPLAWSHAFAILALRQLWPRRTGGV